MTRIVRLGIALGLVFVLAAGLSACRKPTPPSVGGANQNVNTGGGDGTGGAANDNRPASNGNDSGEDGSARGQGGASGNDNAAGGGANDNAAGGGNDNGSGGGANDNASGGGDNGGGGDSGAGGNDNTTGNVNDNKSSASAWLFNISDWKSNPLFAARPDDGRKTRLRERYWGNGKVREQEEVWEDPAGRFIQHGTTVRWHETGTLAERWNFVDGRPDGSMEQYHPNGQPRTFAQWKAGKLNGVMISWDDQGRVLRRAEYSDGELVSNS